MNKQKVIIFGSNGLVGSSLTRILKESDKIDYLFPSTRDDTDLENPDSIKKQLMKTVLIM